jgi:hypothetical protein
MQVEATLAQLTSGQFSSYPQHSTLPLSQPTFVPSMSALDSVEVVQQRSTPENQMAQSLTFPLVEVVSTWLEDLELGTFVPTKASATLPNLGSSVKIEPSTARFSNSSLHAAGEKKTEGKVCLSFSLPPDNAPKGLSSAPCFSYLQSVFFSLTLKLHHLENAWSFLFFLRTSFRYFLAGAGRTMRIPMVWHHSWAARNS